MPDSTKAHALAPHWNEQFSFLMAPPQSGKCGLNVRVRLVLNRLRPKAVVSEAKLWRQC
jgi:hypothetical protein